MRKISGGVALLLVNLCFFVFHLHKELSDHHASLRHSPTTTGPPTTNSSPVIVEMKCERNATAANITDFSSFPKLLQDFLYYRHCRYFPMLLDVPDKCGGADKSANVFLLLVIKTVPKNYERREVLRKTWATERVHNGVQIRRVFIAGTTGRGFEKLRHNKQLLLEKLEYNDILQWDFNDTFYNLTLKQTLFLNWMNVNCPKARFLLNGDDDVFAHTENMVEYLQALKDNDGSKHLFTGHVYEGTGPDRSEDSKYFVPVEVQQDEIYPPYCGGGGFLLSGYTAMVVHRISPSVNIHPIDDAYIGMCVAKAGLRPINHMGVWTDGMYIPSSEVDEIDPCIYQEMLVVHRFLPFQTYLLWHRIHDPNMTCTHVKKTGGKYLL